MNKRVYIIYTGGTIGMQPTPEGYAPAPGYLAEQILSMPELKSDLMPKVEIQEYDPLLDSANMTPEDWYKIAQDIGDSLDVDDLQVRVAGGLRPDQARVGAERGPHIVQVGHIDQRVVDAVAVPDFGDEAVCAAVGVIRQQDVVAGVQQVVHILGGRHAAGVGQAPGAALKGRQRVLQRLPRWVGGAPVFVGLLHTGL